MAPDELTPVTVPCSLLQVVGGVTFIVTPTGATVYGVFSPIVTAPL